MPARAQPDSCRDQTAAHPRKSLELSQDMGLALSDKTVEDCLSAQTLPKDSMTPAACIELFARLSALFTPPRSTQTLWQLAAAVAGHLGDAGALLGAGVAPAAATAAGEVLPRSSSQAIPAGRLGTASSLCKPLAGSLSLDSRAGSISISGGGCVSTSSSSCTGAGCACHLVKVRAGLVSAANQLELSVRGRNVGKACIGAARREEVLQEAAMMHLQAGDAEHCCELLVEVRGASCDNLHDHFVRASKWQCCVVAAARLLQVVLKNHSCVTFRLWILTHMHKLRMTLSLLHHRSVGQVTTAWLPQSVDV